MDAEYYQPEYLEMFKKIKKFETSKANSVCNILRGNTPKGYGEYEIPVIRSGDLSYGFINGGGNLLKAKNENIFFLRDRDVLISSIGFGSIGKVNIFTNENNKFGTVSEVSVLRDCKVSPHFMWAFLAGKFGQFQIDREITGATGQLHLNTGNIENIIIPNINNKIEKETEALYKEAESLYKDSKNYYQQAENLLLEELDLKDFEFEKICSSVVNFSDVMEARRIDAEYFQEKYKNIINKIKDKSKKLENFIIQYSTGYPYKSEQYLEEGIPLIRINNIKNGAIDLEGTAYLSKKDFDISPKDTAKSGDVVLSMSGSIGITAEIPENIPKCAVNQRILKFTPKNIEKDYLVLLLNSIVGSCQLERIGTGGVQTNISYKDIKNILIPILPKATQQKIADLVLRSHEARKKSKELLEEAKRKVEEMIEKGVETNEK